MKKSFTNYLIFIMVVSLILVILNINKTKAAANQLLITEIYYDTIGNDSVEEWVEIYNPTNSNIDLSNYKIGDEETFGGNEGIYIFPEQTNIKPDQQLVIAKDAMGYYNLYHKFPDFEIDTANDSVSDFSNTPNMSKYNSWSTGSLSLTNTGDEIVLLDSSDSMIDAVVFEGGSVSGTTTHLGVNVGESISRNPMDVDTNDCAQDFEKVLNPHPGYGWIYEAEDYMTNIGTMTADGKAEKGLMMSAENDQTTAGYLFYGPYDDTMPAGMYQANFRLRVDDNINNNVVAIIDAHNSGGSGVYTSKKIYATDFVTANNWQNFTIWFERKAEGSMEFRVWFGDEVKLDLDNVMVGAVDRLIYEAEDLAHQTGSIVNDVTYADGAGWQGQSGNGANYMIYGPYDALQSGSWQARVVAKVDDNTNDNEAILININNTFGTDEDKNRIIKGTDFNNPNQWQEMSVNFYKKNNGVMEYRVFYPGNSNVVVDNIIISQTNEATYEAENWYGAGAVVKDANASGGKARKATVANNSASWLVYGPYTRDQEAGDYTAKFRLNVSDNTTSEVVAVISAYNFGGGGVEEAIPIYGTDFAQVNAWQEVAVDFTRGNEGVMEYRVYFTDVADVGVDFVEIEKND